MIEKEEGQQEEGRREADIIHERKSEVKVEALYSYAEHGS
jgi:hypothetical protein